MRNEKERKEEIENELTYPYKCRFREFTNDTWQDGWVKGVTDGIDVGIEISITFVIGAIVILCLFGIINIFIRFKFILTLMAIVYIIYFIVAPKKIKKKILDMRKWRID